MVKKSEEKENEKKKEQKLCPSRAEIWTLEFSVIFSPMIWIFMEIEEPEIK